MRSSSSQSAAIRFPLVRPRQKAQRVAPVVSHHRLLANVGVKIDTEPRVLYDLLREIARRRVAARISAPTTMYSLVSQGRSLGIPVITGPLSGAACRFDM